MESAFSASDRQRPPPLTYGCVCSGISAPTLAAKPLGWKAKFYSEIEPFPRAVLTHHYPETPCHGDFTTISGDTYGTVDLLVGGTPCQSFSVAGKRLGLDDPRGNLALEYVRLAERVDAKWLVFENVPGLLSSAKGDDFAAFISAVTGFDYRPPVKGWRNSGIATGKPGRWGLAWRVLDAQYFGVAQRRRRVFVVGYRGDWRPAAAVLLEPEGLRGNPPPCRKEGKAVAALTAAGVGTCGADDNQGQAGHLLAGTLEAAGGRSRGAGINPGRLVVSSGNVSHCLNAGGMGRQDFETETLIAHTLRGEGFDASEDGTGRGVPLLPMSFDTTQITSPNNRSTVSTGSPCHTLSKNAHPPAIAFSCKDNGRDAISDLAPTLRSMNHNNSHANGGGQLAVCYPILEPTARTGVSTTDPRAGIGIGSSYDPMFTLQAKHQHGVASDSTVRRLTPEECEILQGMPPGYTQIPWRNKPTEQCPDGPRYKAVGNSMAVPCVGWILERLNALHTVLRAKVQE